MYALLQRDPLSRILFLKRGFVPLGSIMIDESTGGDDGWKKDECDAGAVDVARCTGPTAKARGDEGDVGGGGGGGGDEGAVAALFTLADAAETWGQMEELMKEGERMRLNDVAPNVEERWKVFATVLELVHERKRKVYGGVALDAYVRERSPANAFYNMSDRTRPPPDIEFYSVDPVGDLTELCDRLHRRGHEYVQGREAAHANTFTLSVEFVRMCDISYVPVRVFNAIPARAVALCGMTVDAVDPGFAIIDYLRILGDPHTSHWRLDRAFSRLSLLQRFFFADAMASAPRAPPEAMMSNEIDEKTAAAVHRSRSVLASRRDTAALIGAHALEFFSGVAECLDMAAVSEAVARGHVSAISTDFDADVMAVLEALEAVGGSSRVRSVKFHPMMDILGRRTVIFVDDRPIATIVDAAHRPVAVCHDGTRIEGHDDGERVGGTKKECAVRIASFTTTLVAAMAFGVLARANRDAAAEKYFGWMARALCEARYRHHVALGTNIVDPDNPFRDFRLRYIGRALAPMRAHMLQVDERMKHANRKNEDAWFTYDPAKKNQKRRRGFPMMDGSAVASG